jgi:hypothetical protein
MEATSTAADAVESPVAGIAASWAVIGAGPCGIAAVGRLVDYLLAGKISRLIWVDPSFTVGRMGRYYRNVPANTPNQDLIKALNMCPGFNFQAAQQARRQRNGAGSVMLDLAMEECHALGYFVDALKDATTHLRHLSTTDELCGRLELIEGTVADMRAFAVEAVDGSQMFSWNLSIQVSEQQSHHLCTQNVDAIIYACGGTPINPLLLSANCASSLPFVVHHLDVMVDPNYVKSLLQHSSFLQSPTQSTQHWVVVGSSHSAMLIIMNLVNAGVTSITNIYRSDMKFQHKLPSGGWKYVLHRDIYVPLLMTRLDTCVDIQVLV